MLAQLDVQYFRLPDEASDGSALSVCRAGCSQAEVIAALEARGLSRRDLFAGAEVVALNGRQERARSSERLAASYAIEDASRRVSAIHERYEGPSGKQFLWRHPDGRPQVSGARIKTAALPLYGASRSQALMQRILEVMIEARVNASGQALSESEGLGK